MRNERTQRIKPRILSLCFLSLLMAATRLCAQTGPGTALSFDGSGAYLSIGSAPLPPPWTAEFWVNRQDSPTYSAALLADNDTALKLEQYNFIRQVGFTQFGVTDYHFNYTVPAGAWTHLAFVCNGGTTFLYTNGVLAASVAATIALPLAQFGNDKAQDHLNGTIDEVRVWSIARSQAQIQASMNRPLSLPQTNLAAYWRFNEGIGTSAFDSSTNGHTGSFVNGPVWVASPFPFLPLVATQPVSAITTNSAALNLSATPNGQSTTVWFQIGTTTNYGTSTPRTNLGSGTNTLPFQYVVTGLAPATVYHYQAMASNYAGMVMGSDQTFLTMPIYPIQADIMLGRLFQNYDGTPKPIGISTSPMGLNVIVTYNGTTNPPTNVGLYQVSATINNTNYIGSTNATLAVLPQITPAETQIFVSPTNVFIYNEPGAIPYAATVTVEENHLAIFGPVNPVVVGAPQNTLSLQWQRNGVNIPGATNSSYIAPLVGLANSGDVYQCRMTATSAVSTAVWTLTVVPDHTAPEIQSIFFDENGTNNPLKVTVTFSEMMITQSVFSISNYIFTGGRISSNATMNSDGRSVSFNITPNVSSNGQYSLVVKGGADLAGNPLPAGNGVAGIIPFTSTNLALQGFARQSSTNSGAGADRAIDGDTGSVTANQTPETNGWWEVDLGGAKYLGRLHLWFRTDCCSNRQDNFIVKVLDSQRNPVWSETYPGRPPTDVAFNLPPALLGQFVRFEAPVPPIDNGAFSLAEVQVFSSYATNVARTIIPKLVANIFGTNAQLSWRGEGTLQSASSLAGPWSSQTNATSPYNFSFYGTNGPIFFRLINASLFIGASPLIVIDSIDPPSAWPDETVNVHYTLYNYSFSTISGTVKSYVTRDYLTRVLTGSQKSISVPGLGSVSGVLQLSTWVEPVIMQQGLLVPNPAYQPPGTFDVALEFWQPDVLDGAKKVASDTSSINLYPSCGSDGGEISGCVGATIGDCRIVDHPASYVVTGPGRYTFTAHCPAGEQMLGGGYRILPEPVRTVIGSTQKVSDFLSPLIIEASYPSAPDEWTVTVLNPYDSQLVQYMKAEHQKQDQFFSELYESYAPDYVSSRMPTLVVDCYCFASSVPALGMQIVKSGPVTVNYGDSTDVTCVAPQGSVITAGGFSTVPNFSDWQYLRWNDDFGPEFISELMDYLQWNAYLLASKPIVGSGGTASGWNVKQRPGNGNGFGAHNFTTGAYALYSTSGLLAGMCATNLAKWRTPSIDLSDQDGQVHCPPDQFSTGGGWEFLGTDVNPPANYCDVWFMNPHGIDTSFALNDFSGWNIHGLDYIICYGEGAVNTWTVAAKLPPPQLSVAIVSPRDGDCIYADLKTPGFTGPVSFTAVTGIGCEEIDPNLQWQLGTQTFINGHPVYIQVASWTGNNVPRVLSFPVGGMTQYCVTVTATHNGQSVSDTACFSAGCLIF